jgi:glycogen operon protein
MTRRDWESPETDVVGLFLNGEAIGSTTSEGEPIVDNSFVLLVNATPAPVSFVLPLRRFGPVWEIELETTDPAAPSASIPARGEVEVPARSLVLLRAA